MISDSWEVNSTRSTKRIDRDIYPNIHAILSLLLILPVGSCSFDRSSSALRMLKTLARSSMGEMRLNGLALRPTHMHRDCPLVEELDPIEILRK